MAARAGASSGARQGAKKWLASFFGDGVEAAAGSAHAGVATPKSVAKERLQIILAHQRGSQVLAGVDLQALQQELLQCVQRHIRVANGANINIAGGWPTALRSPAGGWLGIFWLNAAILTWMWLTRQSSRRASSTSSRCRCPWTHRRWGSRRLRSPSSSSSRSGEGRASGGRPTVEQTD